MAPVDLADDPHALLTLLLDAADGRFPAVDGEVEVLPPLRNGLGCSFAFTGHAVVATARSAEEVRAQGPDGFGGSAGPDFLRWLAGPDGWIGCLDASLVAHGTGRPGERAALPVTTEHDAHARVRYARELREEVRVFGDERGFVTLSAGLAGRPELSVELPEAARHGKGDGRSLLRDALTLIPSGEPVFAAVSPGNARSLRSFLAVGFVPIGSEVVIRPAGAGRGQAS
ncbi:hypothetical protein [Streptacidiphilus rugosus]|uniref:hypothetical protein n=1 Tax=Streptacidiphilus rugosus TaxID=405783 RepID=UPI00055C8549|nr:hypothetical protein [Streptacidiphilus rugosus]